MSTTHYIHNCHLYFAFFLDFAKKTTYIDRSNEEEFITRVSIAICYVINNTIKHERNKYQ